ncbi:hypothetical protein BZL41_10810 [Pseudomonas sp. PIC25]|uniref:hypothetical protein n=1 Tax=Pseudomonas sp. PIC25 TaxID=1958773 RepID=UPI000BAC09CC|nr:hypothetical protein [Pseudomonas sp. PIC25]PAU64100.1 hypothetical protein BZL41_10810 [Pseudomonas sp. PIC25]
MKIFIALASALSLLAAVPAQASCTPEEATAKAEQLAAKVNELTQSDPEKAAEINEELKRMKVERTAEELESECAAYDKRLQELEEAEKKAAED